MFSIQNWNVKLAYAGFGCLFGSLCTIMGMVASPVTAQKDKFGDIECTSLRVVYADDKHSIWLRTDEHGGVVIAYGKDGGSHAGLGIDEHGGRVGAYGRGPGRSLMSINEYGNGAVHTWDKNGERQ